NSATVTVTVSAVNDAPVGVPDTFTIPNAPRTFTVAELVGNDTDPDKVYGDTLRIQSVSPVSNGTVKLNPDGTVTFTPTAAGAASFTYRVKDATGTVSAASTTVNLTVVQASKDITVVNAVTDNYKDFDGPGGKREWRSWLAMNQIRSSDGVTYALANRPAQDHQFVSAERGIDVRGSDGSLGTVTFRTADTRVQVIFGRYEPNGDWGPRFDLKNETAFPSEFATLKIDMILTVNGTERGRTTLEYRYERDIYHAAYPIDGGPDGNHEANSSGGRWYVNGRPTRLNWQLA
ncbi:Ig-like domain-containing protein, partial [Mycolicibacterium sp. F2034L]|uniref:Ig-like domain-containing protein n=1 Tax=Mycolicibacterium sp. F2034L TaxID=2926422 RepID=UPI001FF1CD01